MDEELSYDYQFDEANIEKLVEAFMCVEKDAKYGIAVPRVFNNIVLPNRPYYDRVINDPVEELILNVLYGDYPAKSSTWYERSALLLKAAIALNVHLKPGDMADGTALDIVEKVTLHAAMLPFSTKEQPELVCAEVVFQTQEAFGAIHKQMERLPFVPLLVNELNIFLLENLPNEGVFFSHLTKTLETTLRTQGAFIIGMFVESENNEELARAQHNLGIYTTYLRQAMIEPGNYAPEILTNAYIEFAKGLPADNIYGMLESDLNIAVNLPEDLPITQFAWSHISKIHRNFLESGMESEANDMLNTISESTNTLADEKRALINKFLEGERAFSKKGQLTVSELAPDPVRPEDKSVAVRAPENVAALYPGG